MSASPVPSVPHPSDVVEHVVVHFLPATIVGVVVGLIALYQSMKAWFELARRSPGYYQQGTLAFRRIVGERRTAAILLGLYSALTVGCAYIIAVLINTAVILTKNGRTQEASESWSLTWRTIEGASWPPAAAWTVEIVSAAIVVYVLADIVKAKAVTGLLAVVGVIAALACGCVALMSFLELLNLLLRLDSSFDTNGKPTGLDIWSQVFVVGLSIVTVLLMGGVASASDRAFRRPN